MSHKRHDEHARVPSELHASSYDKRRKLNSLRSVIQEVMRVQSFKKMLEPALEPLIRRVVKEEIELALRNHSNSMKQNYDEELHDSVSRSLKLLFSNNLSVPVFTGTRVEGEDGSTIGISLVDSATGQIVTSGPESSKKVEIVVLEGDFDGSDEDERWTIEDFKNNIVKERDGKKSLITGDSFLNLHDGIGLVGEIYFTDNSSWTRSRKFKLGARVVESHGIRVREAKSEPFVVRDHRGELYKKHYPPYLSDEVWRIEKIGKDGAFHKRLIREGITTVMDFMRLLSLSPSRLRNILGTGMSSKMWEVTVDHAGTTCILDKRLHLYFPLNVQQKTGVVFNVIGQLIGLLSNGEYTPVEKLSETDKANAQNMVVLAFEDIDHVMTFDDEPSFMAGILHFPKVSYLTSVTPRIESSNDPCMVSLEEYQLHSMDLGYDHNALNFGCEVSEPMMCDNDESISRGFCDVDNIQFFNTVFSPPQNPSVMPSTDLHSAVSGFILPRSGAIAQRRWRKVCSVLRWFWVRKIASLKRLNREMQMQYLQEMI